MKLNVWFGILILALMCSVGFCTNNAALQLTGHTTLPGTIYPGTVAQLEISLTNSGTDTAAGAVVEYKTPLESQYSQIALGDVGTGATATTTIPFTVPANVSSGFFNIDINVVYFSDASKTAIKNSPISIPIQISQHQILSVKTLSVDPLSIQAGDPVTVQLVIENTGGVMNDVTITTPDTSTFLIQGVTQQVVGAVPSGGSTNVSVVLSSSSLTPSGKSTIPLIVSYQDELSNVVNQTIYVGPVTVSASSGQFAVTMQSLNPVEVGSEAQFALTLENLGGSGASPIVDINQTSQFTPIGSTLIYFDSIPPGQNETKIVTLGVGSSIASGYYNLPMSIMVNGGSYVEDIGIAVTATPDVIVTATTQPSFISGGTSGAKVIAQISNTGNSAIRSVYITTEPETVMPVIGATDQFIGTLNVDDFATFQVTVNVPQNLTPGQYNLPIRVEFKDANNIQYNLSKEIPITVYSPMDAARLNGANGATTTGTTTRGRPGDLFGFSYLEIGIALVVIVVAYFGYKRWKASKK